MFRATKLQSRSALLIGLGLMTNAVTPLVIAIPTLAQTTFTDVQGNWSQS